MLNHFSIYLKQFFIKIIQLNKYNKNLMVFHMKVNYFGGKDILKKCLVGSQ